MRGIRTKILYLNPIRFPRTDADFFFTLSSRVNQYFTDNKIPRFGNTEMVIKTIIMFALYTIPYILMITDVFHSAWGMFAMYAVMGLGSAGIGLGVMHDANHGSYSSKRWMNYTLGLSLNMVGGHSFLWKLQHNVLHHTYTNIHEADEDITFKGIMRMAPEAEWKPIHRFQHFYGWFLYGLMTFVWILHKDFRNIIHYQKTGLIKQHRASVVKEWFIMMLSKIVYAGYIYVLPLLLLPYTWWQLFLAFFICHFITGFITAIIFQPAHVIEGTAYPVPDENGNLENNWAIHQLHTTTNFGQKHKIFSWFVGGLNYQVEHHLFPNICHVHYRHITPIVQETARDFGLPYKSKASFLQAIVGHTRLLKELGKKPV